MSLLSVIGSLTGIGNTGRNSIEGGTQVDSAPLSKAYQQALEYLQGVNPNMSEGDTRLQDSVRNSALASLGDLENNGAKRKQYFLNDMGRGFSSDLTNLARSTGGTGNMAQSLSGRNLGSAFDANARARARGLVDLNSQNTADLSGLAGIGANIVGQNQAQQGIQLQRANALANISSGQGNALTGLAEQNANMRFNTNQAVNNKRFQTAQMVGQGIGAVSSPHTAAFKMLGGG